MHLRPLTSSLVAVLAILMLTQCGTNFLQFAALDKTSGEYAAEQAKVLMDKRDYEGARKVLESSDEDSNERRTLLASARLGESGLDIWEILRSLLNGSTSSSGIDSFFNVLTASVFGTGETRTARIGAMRQSLDDLAAAPNPADSSVSDVACFVAALWTVPLVSDAQTALTSMQTALQTVTPTDCSGLDSTDSALATISTLSADFKRILTAIGGCAFIDLSSTAETLNTIETQLNRLTSGADQGCSTAPECTAGDIACQALQYSCVYEKLQGDGSSVANDGIISTCELVQGCLDPDACFQQ
jgi:hypothetical protein